MQKQVNKTSTKLEIPEYIKQEFSIKQRDHAIVMITWNEGERLKRQLVDMQKQLVHVDIIIVDGGSDDDSTDPDYLQTQGVRTLLTSSEPGLGSAIRVGLSYALTENYEGIITIDSNAKDGVDAGLIHSKL